MIRITWTKENEELYRGKIKELQRYQDGNWIIIDEKDERMTVHTIAKALIAKGILTEDDCDCGVSING